MAASLFMNAVAFPSKARVSLQRPLHRSLRGKSQALEVFANEPIARIDPTHARSLAQPLVALTNRLKAEDRRGAGNV